MTALELLMAVVDKPLWKGVNVALTFGSALHLQSQGGDDHDGDDDSFKSSLLFL